jgi:hypothetical protein
MTMAIAATSVLVDGAAAEGRVGRRQVGRQLGLTSE